MLFIRVTIDMAKRHNGFIFVRYGHYYNPLSDILYYQGNFYCNSPLSHVLTEHTSYISVLHTYAIGQTKGTLLWKVSVYVLPTQLLFTAQL